MVNGRKDGITLNHLDKIVGGKFEMNTQSHLVMCGKNRLNLLPLERQLYFEKREEFIKVKD